MRPLATLFALALFTGSDAFAQGTGALKIEVWDPRHLEVPGATVELRSPCLLGGPQIRSTGPRGDVLFPNLPPCEYTVHTTHPALFAPQLVTRVKATYVNNVTVRLSTEERIQVTAVEKAVDVSANRGDVLTTEFLSRVPSGRSYRVATQQAAGVGVGATAGGNPNIGGASNVEAWVNPHVLTARDRQSTFAIDVDTASYAIARRALQEHRPVNPANVRVEEFINAQHYAYDAPAPGEAMTVHLDGTQHPDAPQRHLLRVGIQSQAYTGVRKPVHLTFLVDVSGSMASTDKLPLAKRALHYLVDHLGDEDTVALVTYAGNTRIALQPTPTTRRDRVHQAIDDLRSGGGTAMGSGLELAYGLARDAYLPGCENRVIVLSDGDANIGRVSHDAMLASIAQHAGQGITLTTVGFGTGNYQDHRMEQLANKGDGVNVYIDSFAEAKRVFGRDLSSTIETLARDVKVQVDFDPDVVRAYRLIGYENRDVADEDFREDAVDGGEMGTGHQVTALYELTLADDLSPETTLATVRIRSKKPGPERPSTERSWTATVADVAPDFASARPSVQRAAVVATFAEMLRGSRHAAEFSYGVLLERAQAVSNGGEEDRELLELIQLASQETTALRFRAR